MSNPALAVGAEPRFRHLSDWLSWQQTLHPRAIELGLDRVRRVLAALRLETPPFPILTVGGTNGKGSAVAFTDAILRAAGYRVGAYTSPHLLRYNERIRVADVEVDDAALCEAFAAVDAARGAISLTYFEFGTLAALWLFAQARVEVAVLEVGLGGRLDAVNAVEPNAALVTTVGIDHCDWLGPDRESIGFEKAGIYRAGKPAVCADPQPPHRLLLHAEQIDARLLLHGRDYGYRTEADAERWSWRSRGREYHDLPKPALAGGFQLANAAAALMLLETVRDRLPVTEAAVHRGLRTARRTGRFQVVPDVGPKPLTWIVDVAHNPHAAAALAVELAAQPTVGRTHVVLATLADKDAAGVAQALAAVADGWYPAGCGPAGLGGPRGRAGEQLAATLRAAGITDIISAYPTVEDACFDAAARARRGDRIVVCGSFHTVATALQNVLPVVKASGERQWISS